LQARTEEIDKKIETEEHNVLNELENDYNAARQREGLLLDALNQQKPKSAPWPRP